MSQTQELNVEQSEFFNSTAKNTGFVAGFGSGKSYVSTIKCIDVKLRNPTLTVAYYLPNYGLIRDIAWDKFPTLLSEMGYKYTLNKTDKEIIIDGAGKIIFRSMDNPDTIVGYETFYTIIDECDILNMDKMENAYNKILARNRQKHPDGVPNRLDIVGTPEGFKFFYKRYVKEFNPDTDLLIRASTYSNKHLPPDYIDTLKQQYPENLIEAYLNGHFVNLTSGNIYSYYDRNRHHTGRNIRDTDVLHIGQDFNTGGCVSIVFVIDDDIPHAVDEIISKDTFTVVSNIHARYPNHTVVVYPDASGDAHKTSASRTDIQILKDGGFIVKAKRKNPAVMDRINTANSIFDHNTIRVNEDTCPKLAEALEQHAWDEKGEPEKFNGGGTVDDFTDAMGYFLFFKYGIIRSRTQLHKGT